MPLSSSVGTAVVKGCQDRCAQIATQVVFQFDLIKIVEPSKKIINTLLLKVKIKTGCTF
jgi:hypothetical protein